MIGLNRLMRMAYKSTKKYQHASLIFKGDSIFGIGTNHEYAHAECAAIKHAQAFGGNRTVGASIISIRVRNGKLGIALPCNACLDEIRKAKIRWIFYTDRLGVIQKIQVK